MRRCNHHFKAGSPWATRRFIKKLNLKDAQAAKLNTLQNRLTISESYASDIRQQSAQLVDELLSNDSFDTNAALQLMNIPHRAFEEHVPQIVEAFGDFYQSLDEEQRKQLRGAMAKSRLRLRLCCH